MKQHQLQYGIHVVKVLLEKNSDRILTLYVDQNRTDKRLSEILFLAQSANIKPQKVTRKTLDKMAQGAIHQGIIAECKPLKTQSLFEIIKIAVDRKGLLLILDGVQDPYNLGACLRSAEALGVDGVILVKDRASPLTSTVSKVASGADQIIPITIVTNIAQALKELQQNGLWIIGLAKEASKPLIECDLKGPLALVLGAEDKGLRRLTRERCDQLGHIPQKGITESLNVSLAAGIAIYEVMRQKTSMK